MPEPVFFDQCELLTREDGSPYELGSGEANTTYKGFDKGLQVPVALKIIPSDCLAEEGARERFAAAAQKTMQLRHRHIASVFRYGAKGDKCFFTTEFIEGESLDKVLRREGSVPVQRALEIVAQTAQALQAAALRQIVHGDLRPAKLMLVNDDDETVVKVLGYGLAGRLFSRGAAGTGGHPSEVSADASPEQSAAREIDVRADIYSLGLILWQMLTGEQEGRPIPDPLPVEKIDAARPGLTQLLRRMLERDPARRPQTPGELQVEIDRCLADPAGMSVMIPEPAPTPPEPAASVAPVALEIRSGAPPSESRPAYESTARDEPVIEEVPVASAGEPPMETPPRFSEAEAGPPPEQSSGRLPEPGMAWQPEREGRSWLPYVAVAALLVIILSAGYFGYDYHRRHTVAKASLPMTVEPAPPVAAEPSPVAASTPAPLAISEPSPVAASTPAPPAISEPSQPPPASPKETPPGNVSQNMALKSTPTVPDSEPTPGNAGPLPPSAATAPTPSSTSTPVNATKTMPFVNSLGQQFVPVPGTNVLFCRWLTRVRDWEAFVKAAGEPNTTGMNVIRVKKQRSGDWDTEYELDPKATWKNPGFPQTGEHPVVGVNWKDAQSFCAWLSKKESRTYRLPTDAEWSAAVGTQTYPWGDAWPPPKGAGNYWDEAAVAGLPGKGWARVPVNDGYAFTSPVGTFQDNSFGLNDMGGNVWQWCRDEYHDTMNNSSVPKNNPRLDKSNDSGGASSRVLRGASWFEASRICLGSSFREGERFTVRCSDIGFRCVLVLPDTSAPPPK